MARGDQPRRRYAHSEASRRHNARVPYNDRNHWSHDQYRPPIDTR
jgi:hypothetical protein